MAAPPESPHILLVDDDPSILEGVSDLLKLHGYRVTTASDGLAALEVLQELVPDMIISDISMPRLDGYQLFDAVRQRPEWAVVPFIFLTARGQHNDITRGYTLGIDDYIVKPFEPDDLVAKVGARLRRVREIQAAAESQANQIKNQLLNVFSHELRTPLTYIYGYSSMLREDRPNLDDATIDKMLGSVQTGAERLVRIVEDLLLMIRIDNGLLTLEMERRAEEVSLRPVIDRALTAIQTLAAARRVTCQVDMPADLRVRGLVIHLENVITRLVDNAIRFAPHDQGQVRITVAAHDVMAVIRVTDNGAGINAADRELIFKPFTQVDRAVNEQQGLGLGLAVARSIIELHGGVISVESEPGHGSTFEVRLPLLDD